MTVCEYMCVCMCDWVCMSVCVRACVCVWWGGCPLATCLSMLCWALAEPLGGPGPCDTPSHSGRPAPLRRVSVPGQSPHPRAEARTSAPRLTPGRLRQTEEEQTAGGGGCGIILAGGEGGRPSWPGASGVTPLRLWAGWGVILPLQSLWQGGPG